ncbi:purine nucleoside phosphorylase [Synergistales bacterium]|nr:purine nucleoside phosphorylase [Synergistales bacterium]
MTVFTHAQELIKALKEVTENGIIMLNPEKTDETLAAISRRAALKPTIGIILGSGLGGIADAVENSVSIPYDEIPYWPRTTAIGHAGRLIIGTLEGAAVVVMQGRVHYYEGYTMNEVTFPVRIMGEMGVTTLVATNASGGVNVDYKPGDLVAVCDHINYMGTNPLIGPNNDKWGFRFPDMTHAYDREYIESMTGVAAEEKVRMHKGVYIAFSGPSYETPAEIRMARAMGADVVGMSTVPEVIVAKHMGMRVCAISCVSNHAAGVKDEPLHHEEVLDAMASAADSVTRVIRGFIKKIGRPV